MFKSDLRIKYLNQRFQISDFDLDLKSRLILDIISNNFNLKFKTISLFLPIDSKKEINTYYILEYAFSQKAIIGLPKSNFETNQMIHIEFKSKNQIQLNKYEIPEAIYGESVDENLFDFVFIPLLTIDRKGNRVGYGKGFYDRFLKKCKQGCVFIGLYLFDEFEEIEDLNEFDLTLDYCVTPNQLIKF